MTIDISVIIPAYRRPRMLAETIASALSQTGVTVEVIVIDDDVEGSAEPVVKVLNDPRVTYLKNPQPSRGMPSRVRNLGWPHATGTFVHFLDDDDIVPAGWYAAAKAAFSAHPEVGVIFGRIEPFGDCSEQQLQHETGYFAEATRLASVCQRFGSKRGFVACMMFHWALLVCSAGIVRRGCVARLGGFDPELRLREDLDFYSRAVRRFDVYFLNQVGLRYRIGSPSLMHSPRLTASDMRDLHDAQSRTNAKYRREWGTLEFYALKLLARTVLRIA
jgi:glycosyltransferase involved in cell wall biosynthesis